MQTSVTFKNIDPSDHIKSYVSEKLNRFDKYLYNPAEANVVLSVEKFRHIANGLDTLIALPMLVLINGFSVPNAEIKSRLGTCSKSC